jgi:Tol biopolymer transport system component
VRSHPSRRGLLVALIATALFVPAVLPGATVAGTNGKILFGQVFPNYGVTINPDGSNPIAIGPVDSTTCDKWSPDSSKVLCNLWSPEGVQPGVQPATANPDGSGFSLLDSNLPFDLFCLNWSPSGSRLLCHSDGMTNPADAGLYTVRASDAGDIVRVSNTLTGGFDNGYGYSPDGSRILYTQFDSNEHGTLISVKPDGSDPIQLSPPELSIIDLDFFDRVGADWSPDSSRVAFAAQKLSLGRFISAVFVVNAAGTGLRQVSPSGVGALSAQWSPSGAMIAFSGGCCGLPQAWVVHPDGSGLRRVTTSVNGDVFLAPVWSPDSTKLLLDKVDRNNEAAVWTVNLNGSGLLKLADTPQPSILDWGSAPPD